METLTSTTETKMVFSSFFFGKIRKALFASLFLCALLAIGPGLDAQNSAPSLPMMTTPSPKATMMNQYGNYPVSLYTGLVDITIPIFEIKVNGIRLPIEFRYHASGLKYDDLPMELGYGWTLMAGGTISHSVRGTPNSGSFSGQGQRAFPYVFIKPAEDIGKNQNTRAGTVDNDQTSLIAISNGAAYPFNSINGSTYYKDGEYDEYSYNFAGHSGQTYYLDGSTIKVPANGLSIDNFYNSSQPIVDNDGINYFFTQMESDVYGFNEVSYLTKIVSTNKADTVILDYTKFYPTGTGYHLDRPVIDQNFTVTETLVGPGGSFSHLWHPEFKGNGNIHAVKSFYPPRLNFIQYRGGKVVFVYMDQSSSHSLSEIRIYDPGNSLVRSVKLQKPRTDWLDGVDFKDADGVVKQTYSFEYNGPPSPFSGIDYWGYYNGASNANGYIPSFRLPYTTNNVAQPIDYYTIQGMDRSANQTNMQNGILQKITYPSKGYTVFDYEAHRANNMLYGGLRIKEVRNFDADNNLVERKWYKYGTNESGEGRPASYVSSPNTDDQRFSEDFCDRSMVVLDPESAELSPNVGDKIYTRTYYPFPKMSYFTSGSSVVYPEVAEYSGTGSTTNGKTVYTYTDFPEEKRLTNRGYSTSQLYRTYPWKNGQLLSKTIFDNSGKTVHSLTNKYSYLFDSETLNLSIRQYADIVSSYPPGNPGGSAAIIKNSLGEVNFNPYIPFINAVGGTLFDYYNYYISTGLPVLSSSAEYADGVTKKTAYSDYSQLGLPGEVQVTDSKGYDYTARYQYRYTTVVQQERYKGSDLLSKTMTQYKDWGNGMAEPEIMKFQPTAASPLENRIVYHNRDRYGNPRHVSKDNMDNVVYLWGYRGMYLVAEIRNATYGDVVNAMGGQANIDRIADAVEPAAVDLVSLNSLRSNAGLNAAQVTTYTYVPLVGMASSTDPQGNSTVYRYDGFGRLVLVFDKDNKVVKRYCYNYAGQQTDNCAVTSFKNTVVSKTFKRNNCAAGEEGGDMVYTVPAGKHESYVSQADADRLAQNEMDVEGQGYANQYGACLSLITYTFTVKNYISVNAPSASNNTNFNITITGRGTTGVQMVAGNGGTVTVRAVAYPSSNASIVVAFYPYSGSPAARYVTMTGPFGTKTANTALDNTATFTGVDLTTAGPISVSFN